LVRGDAIARLVKSWQKHITGGSAMIPATYQVTVMTCEHCVHAVTGELTNLSGVTGVAVDFVPGGRSASPRR
jgi:Heavy-metal-associated domain